MLSLISPWALYGAQLVQATPIDGDFSARGILSGNPLLDTKIPRVLAELSISPALNSPTCGKSYSDVMVSLTNRPDPALLPSNCGRLMQSLGNAMSQPAVISLICSSTDNIRSDPATSKLQLAMVMKDDGLANGVTDTRYLLATMQVVDASCH
jgi:hypothetical protein